MLAIHGGFRSHSMALRVTFPMKSNQKSFRNLFALRVPAAFFEIDLRKVAQIALPVRLRSIRHPWRIDLSTVDFKKQIRCSGKSKSTA